MDEPLSSRIVTDYVRVFDTRRHLVVNDSFTQRYVFTERPVASPVRCDRHH